MTPKAKWFTKQLHTDFDRDEQVHVLFSEPEPPDGKQPRGGIWLKFEQHLEAPLILVRAETSEGVLGTFPAKISDHRSFIVPLELEENEFPGVQEIDCPVKVIRTGKPDSDAARFWVLMDKNNTPRIVPQTTTGSVFGGEVRPHEKRGQRRSVSIMDYEWYERHVRFIEVSIADLPPCLGGPSESLDTWKSPTA